MARPNDPRSLTALAKRIDGLSNNGLKKAIADGRCPPIPEGAFDVDDYVQRSRREIKANTRPALSRAARMQQQQPIRPPEPGDEEVEPVEGDLSLAEASRRLEWEKHREKRLKNDELEGDLLDAEEVKQSWVAMITVAKSRLLGLPAAIGPEVALVDSPQECTAIIAAAMRECLKDLSEYGEIGTADCGGDEGMGPSSGTDGERVGG
ncbi:MAG TPA: hypothetical protein VGM43_22910 [Bryobacteraceae bacterium]|jgi:hypothetical protein